MVARRISKVEAIPGRISATLLRLGMPRMRSMWWLFLLWPLLLSCGPAAVAIPTAVRPVVKIGLLASFEGLHRRSGYEALAAMRLALDTYVSDDLAIIPLAVHLDQSQLDQSYIDIDAGMGPSVADARGDVWRTVQKVLADPDVKAVVGPYDPSLMEAIKPVLTPSLRSAQGVSSAAIPWFAPLFPDPTERDPVAAFAQEDSTDAWALALVQDVAKRAATQGAERLLLAGWQPGWPALTTLADLAAPIPVVVLADPMRDIGEITANDALFWMGALEAGAAYLAAVHQQNVAIAFWFGQGGGEPIVPELLSDQLTFDSSSVYWVTLLDEVYLTAPNFGESIEGVKSSTVPNTVSHIGSLSPSAYLTFRATQAAIASLDPAYVPPPLTWHVVHFALQLDGTSRRLK